MMRFKTITTNLSTIVHLIVEPITSLVKPKACLDASIFISQLPLTVSSSKPVISPSLLSFLFFCNIPKSNRYWWGNVESHVGRGNFFNSDHDFYIALKAWKASPLGKWVLLGWTVKCGFKKWQPLHLHLMESSLSPSDKCRCPWGQHVLMQRRVGCMAKGMCLIQSNKTKKCTANSFI